MKGRRKRIKVKSAREKRQIHRQTHLRKTRKQTQAVRDRLAGRREEKCRMHSQKEYCRLGLAGVCRHNTGQRRISIGAAVGGTGVSFASRVDSYSSMKWGPLRRLPLYGRSTGARWDAKQGNCIGGPFQHGLEGR